ncbi:pseudouridine synthase [Variovorax sp. PCZ-1]|nr:pseudouridine synthase [Variovorax sp. PCZ-1]MBS7807548.1 pseudouridine synthase [Variovorax sp. PCZ-1]
MVLPPLSALDFSPDSLLSFLEHSAHNSRRLDWEKRLKNGLVVDDDGQALAIDAPYLTGQRIHYWRDAGIEPRIPFDEQIIYQDDHILVADKPHFLPVTPTGGYVQETLLVRLKKRTGLTDLTPMHRIDRDTAGLVMFCIRVQERDAYAAMFRERQLRKIYECIAPYSRHIDFPLIRKTRLVSSPDSFMQMVEIPGEPNSETHIDLIEGLGEYARYQLRPISGKRHQLRVHMNALGLSIRGDGIYPTLTPETAQADYDHPLQLLAKCLAFTDPVTSKNHEFCSQIQLGWPPNSD